MNDLALRTTSLLSLCLALGACGGTCPETTTAGMEPPSSSGAERPMLTAETTAPETMDVSLDELGVVGGSARLDNRHVANVFGCTGENHSPAIRWSGAPEGTRSFVLEVHDPDAPTGVGFFHWIVVDLPTTTEALPFDGASALPAGAIATRNDYGSAGYGGACPPPGSPHRYVFTIYAVDTEHLGVDENASPAVVRFMLGLHTLAIGRATATYGRTAE
jgi:hypothetical protein